MNLFDRFRINKSLLSFSCLLLIISFGGCKKGGADFTSRLLPAPQEVNLKDGFAFSPLNIKTIYLCPTADDNDRFAANLLRDNINRLYGYIPGVEIVKSHNDIDHPSIILGIPSEDELFQDFCSGISSPKENNEESYVLDVNNKLVIVSGGGKPGLFYGIQSLIQLMEESKWEDKPIQGMEIRDWPELKLRFVHYNYFYHLDRYEYIKESVAKLAKYKVNGIVFEFEDKFKYQSHPFIAAPNSLTSQQVKELTQFAHKYHVDIIPLVQGFGHAGYLLKHEELKHLREDPEIFQSFCPMKDETYELIFDLFRETIEATPGVKYFHVGADEVRAMGKCPLCREKKEEVGDLGLYLTWLNKVHGFMEDHHRTMIFWDDMPLKQAGIYRLTYNEADEKFDSVWAEGTSRLENIITRFPGDAVFMRWNYGLARDLGNIKTLDWYKNNGFNSMVATAIIGNYPLIPDYDWTPANIKSFVSLGADKGVSGELCTAWGDDAGNHFEIYWLGFLASAEYAWSSKSPGTLDLYWDKYIRRFFGPNAVGLVPAFHNLSERVEFWNSALMEKGLKNRRGHRLITLPQLNSSPGEESWTKHFQPIVELAVTEKIKCINALDTITMNIDRVDDNVYNLQVFASMGRLMKAHCDVVLSVGEIAKHCDIAINAHDKGDRELVVASLEKMASVADSTWKEYSACYQEVKDVWEVARYPKGGEGYMLNKQTNYLAGWTADLSYLILAEKQLDFPGYSEKLRKMAANYQETGIFKDL